MMSETASLLAEPITSTNPKITDRGQQTPIDVQPSTSNCHSFCWLAACCCWCPSTVLKNWSTERIRAMFCLTLQQSKKDREATTQNEAKLSAMSFDSRRFNYTITATQPTPTTPPILFAAPPPITLTYGGHATMELNIGGHIVLIDPTTGDVSDYPRKIPEFFTTEKMTATLQGLKAVVASHNHLDHNNFLKNQAVREQQPLVITGAHSRWPKEWGYKNVQTLQWGQQKEIQIADGVTLSITGIPAQHSSARKGYGCGGCMPTAVVNLELWLGIFFEINYHGEKYNIYYTGDTGEGKQFKDVDGNTVALKDYVIALAKQRGGIDFIFAQVGPHEPFGDGGESPMHMGPKEIVTFTADIIAAMRDSGNSETKVPYIIPLHHSAFSYEKPRGYFLVQFLLEAAKKGLDRVVPLAIKGSINLGEILTMPVEKIKAAFYYTVASLHQPNGIFGKQEVRNFFDIENATAQTELRRTNSVENLGKQFFDFTR